MSALAGLFDRAVATAWQVALLIVAVILAQRLFGRWLSPRGRYALWLLVVLRLLVPSVPELPVGLVDWTRATVPGAPPAPALPPLVRAKAARKAAPEPPPAVGAAPPEDVDPARRPAASPPRLPLGAMPPDPPAKRAPWSWKAGAAALWLAVALALLARAALLELRFRRRLRAAEPVREPEPRALLERCRRALGLRRAVSLVRVDELRAPAVHGWLRPRVLFPASALARLDAAGLERVLRHELAHVRHHDVALNALLVALRALWWPHPLVHLAARRLRAAQEALRDWEAVRSEGSPAPLAYARTLLALASTGPASTPPGAIAFVRRGQDTQERILMIANYRRPGPAAGVLALLLFTALGLASLTSARAALPAAEPDQLRHVEAERDRPTEPWRAELERQLQRTTSFDCVGCSLADALEQLRRAGELNLVLAPEVLEQHGELELDLRLPETTLAEVLDAICARTEELDHCLLRGAVYLGPRDSMPEALELRFYKIAPLLEIAPEEARDQLVHDVVTLVVEVTATEGWWGSWDSSGVWIEPWDDVLAVHQTEAMHARVQRALDRLLNRGAEPQRAVPEWERELRAKLAAPASLELDGITLPDALAALAAEHGVAMRLEADDEGEPLTLRLADVELGTALDWLAALTHLYVDLRREGIVLTDSPPKVLRLYEVGELFGPTWDPHDPDLRDRVVEAMRLTIDPESWDNDPRCMVTWFGDLMVVVQSEVAHARIAELLAAVRRATAP